MCVGDLMRGRQGRATLDKHTVKAGTVAGMRVTSSPHAGSLSAITSQSSSARIPDSRSIALDCSCSTSIVRTLAGGRSIDPSVAFFSQLTLKSYRSGKPTRRSPKIHPIHQIGCMHAPAFSSARQCTPRDAGAEKRRQEQEEEEEAVEEEDIVRCELMS